MDEGSIPATPDTVKVVVPSLVLDTLSTLPVFELSVAASV
jgi:hypothetical protein